MKLVSAIGPLKHCSIRKQSESGHSLKTPPIATAGLQFRGQSFKTKRLWPIAFVLSICSGMLMPFKTSSAAMYQPSGLISHLINNTKSVKSLNFNEALKQIQGFSRGIDFKDLKNITHKNIIGGEQIDFGSGFSEFSLILLRGRWGKTTQILIDKRAGGSEYYLIHNKNRVEFMNSTKGDMSFTSNPSAHEFSGYFFEKLKKELVSTGLGS